MEVNPFYYRTPPYSFPYEMDCFKGESLRNVLVEEKIPVKWIGLRENLQGKPAGFYSQVHDLFFGAYCTFVPEAGD